MLQPLTARQEQIVALLLQGAGNRQIGQELGLAERTVKVAFEQLFARFGITGKCYAKRTRLAVQLYKEGRCPQKNLNPAIGA